MWFEKDNMFLIILVSLVSLKVGDMGVNISLPGTKDKKFSYHYRKYFFS